MEQEEHWAGLWFYVMISDWMLRCGRGTQQWRQVNLSLQGRGLRHFDQTCLKKHIIKNKHMHGLIVHNKVFKMYIENSG